MTAFEYINQYKVALLKSNPRQLEEERIDLRKTFTGDISDFDKAWQHFLMINAGRFRIEQ